MDDTKLRTFIREKVLEFLNENKILSEAEKEGHGKPTSGLKKEKVGTTHTEKTKSKNPPAKKVTDDGPDNKTLADSEPTEVESENKEKKEPDNTEFTDRGKYVKEGNGYETECMGIELKVKGSSYADINHLYLLAQMRKALEGRGEFIKKVTVEMGEKEKEKVEESKEVQTLRKKIREIVGNELKKKSKKINETGEMGRHDIEPGGEDYEWSEAIKNAVLKIEKLTNGRLKFLEMKSFDKYQGPYASVTINGKHDSIWGASSSEPEDMLYIENLDLAGVPELLANAIGGDKTALKIARQAVEMLR